MSVATSQEVYGNGDGWEALPRFAYRPESHTSLLDLGEDYEMGFGDALTPALSPVQNTVSTPSSPGFERRPQQHEKVITLKMTPSSFTD